MGLCLRTTTATQSVECIEDGEVLTILYDKLLEIYMQNPEFGYYFLRLTSDRLLQNHARLEGLVEESKAALDAAIAAQTAAPPSANQPQPASPAADDTAAADNAVEMAPDQATDQAADLAETASISPSSAADIELAKRRMRALAIVDRHANYCAAGRNSSRCRSPISLRSRSSWCAWSELSKVYGGC